MAEFDDKENELVIVQVPGGWHVPIAEYLSLIHI